MSKQTRDNIISALVIALMVAVILCLLAGCKAVTMSEAATSATVRSDNLNAALVKSGSDINAGADLVEKAAKAGFAATPPELLGILSPFWQQILDGLMPIRRGADGLKLLQGDVAAIKADVKRQEQERVNERKRQEQSLAEVQARLDKANSEATRRLFSLALAGVVVCGIAVGLAVWLGGSRIFVAGAAASAAVATLAVVLSRLSIQVDKAAGPFWMTVGVGGGLCLLWVVAETIIRSVKLKSVRLGFIAAIKTSPVQDIQDLIGGAVPATQHGLTSEELSDFAQRQAAQQGGQS